MIEELLEADIIERVDGLTTWASAVAIALKLNSNIRLYVDIRQENEAIVRESGGQFSVNNWVENVN